MTRARPAPRAGSASLDEPGYWWYRAREELLREALGPYLGSPLRTLDVGSADGPSVGWLRASDLLISVDVQSRGLVPGRGVCASVLALPFADESFDVISAFDVLEHCAPEDDAVAELIRILAPGGRLLMSVPAYQWAWTDHDVRAGHYRRYTRRRLLDAVSRHGLDVQRVTHAFAGVFPLFAAERVARRLRNHGSSRESAQLPPVSPTMERLLLGLCKVDGTVLRHGNLPFGSSILLAAVKTPGGASS